MLFYIVKSKRLSFNALILILYNIISIILDSLQNIFGGDIWKFSILALDYFQDFSFELRSNSSKNYEISKIWWILITAWKKNMENQQLCILKLFHKSWTF